MNINFCSDLHLDISPTTPVLPGGDVLILAGDLCEANSIKKLSPAHYETIKSLPENELTREQRIARFFIQQCEEKYAHVIAISGNHEGYNFVFDDVVPHMKENLPSSFHVLDNSSVEINNVIFIGATLWTDMNRDDPMTKHAVKYGMNDFRIISKRDSGYDFTNDLRIFSVNDAIKEHNKTLAYFTSVLEDPKNVGKKFFVISHHAPSSLSVAQEYKRDVLMNGGYHSRLEEFILDHPQLTYWVHGHTHTSFDYMLGGCRVMCNPRGYQSRYSMEDTGFDPNRQVEL